MVNYHRHLLQVAYADRLVGAVVERLRDTGLYDPSLLVWSAQQAPARRLGAVGRRRRRQRRIGGVSELHTADGSPPTRFADMVPTPSCPQAPTSSSCTCWTAVPAASGSAR
jgi:hypothetical protein